MSETYDKHEIVNWDGDHNVLFDALRAAMKAGEFAVYSIRVRIKWAESRGEYHDLDKAQERVSFQTPTDVRMRASNSEALTVSLSYPSLGHVSLASSGTDWAACQRAYAAANDVLSKAHGAFLAAQAAASAEAIEQSKGTIVWLESHRGLIAVIGIAITITIAVIGWLVA